MSRSPVRFRLGPLGTFLILAAAWGLAGCQSPPMQNVVLGPDYQPSNIYRRVQVLPPDFRRVAVLPLSGEDASEEAVAGRQALAPVLRTELLKTKRFELAWVTSDALERRTGRRLWRAEDPLPRDFLENLQKDYGCDGVLFCRLSRYHAYPPLVIGWKLKLVEVKNSETLWAADEIFDAGEPPVSNSARRYEHQHQKGSPATDSPLILNSPERFGHYTAATVLETLPTH